MPQRDHSPPTSSLSTLSGAFEMLWAVFNLEIYQGRKSRRSSQEYQWAMLQKKLAGGKKTFFVQDLTHSPWPAVERWAELDASDKEVFEAQAEEAKSRYFLIIN